MSSIYILEPGTSGKVLLKTTVGDIDVELWSKEAPKACRNFVQLCMECYYDGTIFHRVVKNFIVQGGDRSGSGMGGESTYGQPFKDELHQRLRFNRRGLVAMANEGTPDTNTSQFFFTLGETPELNQKHTIFGKVAGNTLYNMLKLGEGEVDANTERPKYPHKVLSTEILDNPFPDIVPRRSFKLTETVDERRKMDSGQSVRAVKSFKLLSFGDEAEEDEAEVEEIERVIKTKTGGKSAHDLLADEKLSKTSAQVELQREEEEKRIARDMLGPLTEQQQETKRKQDEIDAWERERQQQREAQLTPDQLKKAQQDDIQRQIDSLTMELRRKRKAELATAKKAAQIALEAAAEAAEAAATDGQAGHEAMRTDAPADPYMDAQAFRQEKRKQRAASATDEAAAAAIAPTDSNYVGVKRWIRHKPSDREEATLKLLEHFQHKLHSAANDADKPDQAPEAPKRPVEDAHVDAPRDGDDWLRHKLHFINTLDDVLRSQYQDIVVIDSREENSKADPLAKKRLDDIEDMQRFADELRAKAGGEKRVTQETRKRGAGDEIINFQGPSRAFDASTASAGERYDLNDPRNPINQRRRQGDDAAIQPKIHKVNDSSTRRK